MSKESLEIRINNWNEYQPRKDLKSLSWVRIQSDVFFTENFFELNLTQKVLFFYVLTYAGKKNSDSFKLNIEFVCSNLELTKSQLLEGIAKLEQLEILTILVTDSSRIRTDLCTTNDTIHNEHNITNDTIRTISPEPQRAVAVVNSSVFIISPSQQIPIKTDLVRSWADTYPRDYLELSFKEMRNWVLSNQHKAPKSNWTRFMNNWFARGWERHRTTMKSNPVKLTEEALNEILKGENGI